MDADLTDSRRIRDDETERNQRLVQNGLGHAGLETTTK
jgi:hypothetical protein